MKTKEIRNKENALNDFLEMIYNSWSYQTLTDEEKNRFKRLEWVFERIKGTYKQRFEYMNYVYHAFVEGIGGTETLMKRQERGE